MQSCWNAGLAGWHRDDGFSLRVCSVCLVCVLREECGGAVSASALVRLVRNCAGNSFACARCRAATQTCDDCAVSTVSPDADGRGRGGCVHVCVCSVWMWWSHVLSVVCSYATGVGVVCICVCVLFAFWLPHSEARPEQHCRVSNVRRVLYCAEREIESRAHSRDTTSTCCSTTERNAACLKTARLAV